MSEPDASFPWLVADIGGTNARFGLVERPGAQVGGIVSLRCADYPGPEEAALDYLQHAGLAAGTRPRLAAFAVATPVHQDPVRMTNSNWVLSRESSARRIGVRRLYLFNDFEALALALPSLREHDVEYFGNGRPDRMLPMAVIGPGTGLGVAACVPTPRGWIPLSGEGGHVTVSAASAFESELIEVLRAEYPHISAERLLSGIGLPVLYGAVCAVRGTTPAQLGTEAICDLALADTDDACVTTLDTFCAMLGTFAGNVALTVGARGGVFIAGGIAPRLGRRFTDSRFRERFEAKGRFAGYMASIATGLITAPHAALTGAAQGIANDQTPAPLP